MQDPWISITSAASRLQTVSSMNQMSVQRGRIFGVDSLICRPGPAGKLTRLHIFMVVGLFPPGWATRQMCDGFMKEAVAYSIENKGGLPRGSQTGTATVAVVLTDKMVPDAERWAARPRKSRFAAMGFPVTVELAENRVTHPKRMVLGAVYLPTLKRFVAENVIGALYPGSESV